MKVGVYLTTERPIHYCARGTGRSHSNLRQWLDYVKTLFKYCAIRLNTI